MYFTGVDKKDKKRIKYRYYYDTSSLEVNTHEEGMFEEWKKTLLEGQTPVNPNNQERQNYYDSLEQTKKNLLDCYTLKVGHYDNLSEDDMEVIRTYRRKEKEEGQSRFYPK